MVIIQPHFNHLKVTYVVCRQLIFGRKNKGGDTLKIKKAALKARLF